MRLALGIHYGGFLLLTKQNGLGDSRAFLESWSPNFWHDRSENVRILRVSGEVIRSSCWWGPVRTLGISHRNQKEIIITTLLYAGGGNCYNQPPKNGPDWGSDGPAKGLLEKKLALCVLVYVIRTSMLISLRIIRILERDVRLCIVLNTTRPTGISFFFSPTIWTRVGKNVSGNSVRCYILGGPRGQNLSKYYLFIV